MKLPVGFAVHLCELLPQFRENMGCLGIISAGCLCEIRRFHFCFQGGFGRRGNTLCIAGGLKLRECLCEDLHFQSVQEFSPE